MSATTANRKLECLLILFVKESFQISVMAFLRSLTRCNTFVSKKLHLRSSVEFNAKFSRSELLASHRYYNELKRELNTRFNSSIASATSAHKPQQKTSQNEKGVSPKDPLDVTFNNPNAAFKSKTTGELLRGYIVYLLCSSTYLVDNNLKVRNSIIKSIYENSFHSTENNFPHYIKKSIHRRILCFLNYVVMDVRWLVLTHLLFFDCVGFSFRSFFALAFSFMIKNKRISRKKSKFTFFTTWRSRSVLFEFLFYGKTSLLLIKTLICGESHEMQFRHSLFIQLDGWYF